MLLLLNALLQLQGDAPTRTMAITIDDPPTASVLGEDIERAERTTRELLTRGKRGAYFAGEPEVPGWVQEAAAGR